MIRLDNQVAIITGSGRSLGAAYACLLAERGARVVIHDTGANKDGTGFDPNVAVDAASRIREAGGVAFPSHVILDSRDNCQRKSGNYALEVWSPRHLDPQCRMGCLSVSARTDT